MRLGPVQWMRNAPSPVMNTAQSARVEGRPEYEWNLYKRGGGSECAHACRVVGRVVCRVRDADVTRGHRSSGDTSRFRPA